LVRLYKDRLGRADKAARHLHELLTSDPENLEVLDLYIQHFREKGDWRSQAETMETALRVAHAQGVDPSYVIDLLKEMATIYRSKLGDLARYLMGKPTERSAPRRAKNIEMRWSTASQVGRSRSSPYTLSWVLPVRTLARQSMLRVSSPGRYWRSSMKSRPRPRTRARWRPASWLWTGAPPAGQRSRRTGCSSASRSPSAR